MTTIRTCAPASRARPAAPTSSARQTGPRTGLGVAALAAALAVASPLMGQEQPFGSPQQVAFAKTLWQAMDERGIVGDDAMQSHPYAGTSMHGPVIQYLSGEIGVGERTGTFILKRNYRGDDLSVEEVFEKPLRNFDSMGVMFRREAGYAPESADWFWVKYMPDGTVATTPEGVGMAGQVGACISCHEPAEGGDFVFSHDRYAR